MSEKKSENEDFSKNLATKLVICLIFYCCIITSLKTHKIKIKFIDVGCFFGKIWWKNWKFWKKIRKNGNSNVLSLKLTQTMTYLYSKYAFWGDLSIYNKKLLFGCSWKFISFFLIFDLDNLAPFGALYLESVTYTGFKVLRSYERYFSEL